MSDIIARLDRGIGKPFRYQFYNNTTDGGDFFVQFNFKSDLGRAAHTGYIKNNSANILLLYFNYDSDPSGSMNPVVLGGADTFSFSPMEFAVSTLKIEDDGLAETVNVDVFVS